MFLKTSLLGPPSKPNKILIKNVLKTYQAEKNFLGPYDPFRNKIYQNFVFYLPTYIYISIISLDDQ